MDDDLTQRRMAPNIEAASICGRPPVPGRGRFCCTAAPETRFRD